MSWINNQYHYSHVYACNVWPINLQTCMDNQSISRHLWSLSTSPQNLGEISTMTSWQRTAPVVMCAILKVILVILQQLHWLRGEEVVVWAFNKGMGSWYNHQPSFRIRKHITNHQTSLSISLTITKYYEVAYVMPGVFRFSALDAGLSFRTTLVKSRPWRRWWLVKRGPALAHGNQWATHGNRT